MSRPRISVITPCFNRGRFLERSICSVLDQGYPDLEYWVVDGGSNDQTTEIRKQYEHDLAGWLTVPEPGLSAAINAGLARATGQIIAVLDADDLYLPGALDAVVAAMFDPAASDADCQIAHPAQRPGARWVLGQCIRIGPEDQMLGWLCPETPRSLASFLMHDSGLLPAAACFYRRDLIDQHGTFDDDLPLAGDYEYACRLLAAGEEPLILRQQLVARREEPGTIDAPQTLACGSEYIAAARRHGEKLPLQQQYALWRNCDARERIYKLAESEIKGTGARRFLWQELLRHPWWLADDAVRRALRAAA